MPNISNAKYLRMKRHMEQHTLGVKLQTHPKMIHSEKALTLETSVLQFLTMLTLVSSLLDNKFLNCCQATN